MTTPTLIERLWKVEEALKHSKPDLDKCMLYNTACDKHYEAITDLRNLIKELENSHE